MAGDGGGQRERRGRLGTISSADDSQVGDSVAQPGADYLCPRRNVLLSHDPQHVSPPPIAVGPGRRPMLEGTIRQPRVVGEDRRRTQPIGGRGAAVLETAIDEIARAIRNLKGICGVPQSPTTRVRAGE